MTLYPKISIVTPSFNQGRYLEGTIRSILDQGYPNLEYIVIDGGSKDNSTDVIKQYQNRIAYWVSEPDRGQSHAINKGIRISSGEIVTWINSDDLVSDGALFNIAKVFRDHPEVGVVHGATIYFDERGDGETHYGCDNPTLEHYLTGMPFAQPSSYIRRKALDRVGVLNEEYHYGMDYDLFARLALVTPFRREEQVYSKYRLHPLSKTVAHNDLCIEEWIAIFLNVLYNIGAHDELKALKKRRVFSESLYSSTTNYDFVADEKPVNVDTVILSFLRAIFIYDYNRGEFIRARAIARFLTEKVEGAAGLDGDLRRAIARASKYPGSILRVARSIKQWTT